MAGATLEFRSFKFAILRHLKSEQHCKSLEGVREVNLMIARGLKILESHLYVLLKIVLSKQPLMNYEMELRNLEQFDVDPGDTRCSNSSASLYLHNLHKFFQVIISVCVLHTKHKKMN